MKTISIMLALYACLGAGCGAASDPDVSAGGAASEVAAERAEGADASPVPEASSLPAEAARAMRFEALSRTAEAFTGAVTLTPELRASPDAPPAMQLVADNGLSLRTELMARGAEDTDRIDWTVVFGDSGSASSGEAGRRSIDMHRVIAEAAPAGSVNGGLCGKGQQTAFLAMATGQVGGNISSDVSGDQPYLAIAAFRGPTWPPAGDAALCGVFNYLPPA